MSPSLLDYSNQLIDENHRRINRIRAELATEALDENSLRLRVVQQMELSLQCLERHRNALASRIENGGLGGQDA
jgi:hypothetical protein